MSDPAPVICPRCGTPIEPTEPIRFVVPEDPDAAEFGGQVCHERCGGTGSTSDAQG